MVYYPKKYQANSGPVVRNWPMRNGVEGVLQIERQQMQSVNVNLCSGPFGVVRNAKLEWRDHFKEPSHNVEVQVSVCPLFTAVTTSPLLGSFFIRCWNIAARILLQPPFVRSGTDFGWLSQDHQPHFSSSQRNWMRLRCTREHSSTPPQPDAGGL